MGGEIKKEFLAIAEKIKSFGFYVYITDSEYYNYGYYTDNTNIAYFQYDRFDGLSLTTVHKPCREHGTGFIVEKNIPNISKVLLYSAFGVPTCFGNPKIERYKNFDDFINKHHGTFIKL